MTDPNSLEAAADSLRGMVAQLNDSVQKANDVRTELDDLIERSKFNRKLTIVASCGAAICLVIGIVLGTVIIQLREVVQVQKDSALCPLYKIFLESNTPENRERARLQGQDMDERDRAFRVIQRSSDALECAD